MEKWEKMEKMEKWENKGFCLQWNYCELRKIDVWITVTLILK